MLHRLKPRPNLYVLPNQPRSHRGTVIRWVYLACIFGLFIWLGDLFVGSLFYLRSDGLVLAEPAAISPEFPVTVRDILVREGESVKAGSVAAIVSSQSAAENIARLTAELAAREARLSDLRVRAQKVDAVLDLAETRQEVTVDARRQLEKLVGQGLLSLDKRTAAVESEFRSLQDLEALRAERRAVEGEIDTLQIAEREAGIALRDLRHLYDDGQMRVPIDGIVSRVPVGKGAVVRAGEPLMEIYGGQRFVIAYLPTGSLYDVAIGDRVQISTGLRTAEGIVTRVEPFAAALPRELQRAFVPVERQQVLRVEYAPGETLPPLFTKVQLRSIGIIPRWLARMWAKVGVDPT